MAFIDDLFKKLFPGRQANRQFQVMEELRRSQAYQQAYGQWLGSKEAQELIGAVEKSYYLKKNQVAGEYPVHLFESAAANGFALSYHPNIQARQFQFLLDYFRDRVLTLGYRLANTDRQIKEKESYIKTTEKHYLKPPLSKGRIADQRYGNVLLEYVLIDQQPSYLKLMVTIYTDHLFTEAQAYDELLDYLFSLD